eukprot:CAMPEP_0185832772 /NCGR_PEP_ID=MMETSP1353-20130828/2283_1 /TAXON_ID=1077150 /ORGANISM="Erythrolobus australicus, Strain CCMP3124" /LENGTH=345 /DNA_ID=CAMNT_0028530995 /DNA_START=56 /DNA_END=1093 /DNA_ORIENTATION=+
MTTDKREASGFSGEANAITRRTAMRGAATLAAVTFGGALVVPQVSHAFCDEPDPLWAHYVSVNDQVVRVKSTIGQPSTKVFTRLIGSRREQKRAKVHPVVFVPDAGFPMEYLEPLQALAESQRQLLFYDPCGSGASKLSPENATQTYSVQASIDELDAVVRSRLGPDLARKSGGIHIWAHGTGARVALLWAHALGASQSRPDVKLDDLPCVRSLVLESPAWSYPDFVLETPANLIGGGSIASEKLRACAVEALSAANPAALKAIGSARLPQWPVNTQPGTLPPVLVLESIRDESIDSPESRQQLEMALRSSVKVERVSVQGANHAPHLDRNNEQLLRATVDFLDG